MAEGVAGNVDIITHKRNKIWTWLHIYLPRESVAQQSCHCSRYNLRVISMWMGQRTEQEHQIYDREI